MMAHTVRNNNIAKEQFSVTRKKSISHALNKTLLFDNIRYQKISVSLTYCDLRECYDRISHPPAMLAARSFGIPKNPLISFFATLQDVQYHTRTCYGVSEKTFGGLHNNFSAKPQGAGQGNGATPQLWAVLSSKMFHMLHTLGLTTKVVTPISNTNMMLVGFAYVDDSDLFTYSLDHDVYETVKKMQSIVNAWEQADKVTGGAIAPLKCWWYLLFFEWDDEGNWKYGQVENQQYSLTACDATGTIQTINTYHLT